MGWLKKAFKKVQNVARKIDPIGHKVVDKVVAQDSRNVRSIAKLFGGNAEGGNWASKLYREADRNVKDPQSAQFKAALTAGAIFGGMAAYGAVAGGGAAAGGSAAGGITGTGGASGMAAYGAGSVGSGALGTAGTASLGAGAGVGSGGYLAGMGAYQGLGAGFAGAGGITGTGGASGMAAYEGASAPFDAFGTASTNSVGGGNGLAGGYWGEGSGLGSYNGLGSLSDGSSSLWDTAQQKLQNKARDELIKRGLNGLAGDQNQVGGSGGIVGGAGTASGMSAGLLGNPQLGAADAQLKAYMQQAYSPIAAEEERKKTLQTMKENPDEWEEDLAQV